MDYAKLKSLLEPLRAAQRDFEEGAVRAALFDLCAPGARFRHCHPFGDIQGPDAFYDAAYAPLFTAMPDLERRDWIVIAGPTEHGGHWVGCGGHYVCQCLQQFAHVCDFSGVHAHG